MSFPVTRRRRATQGGNTLLEFALMATVLMLMTLGVVDFSRMFYVADMAMNAAAAGTEWGALSPAHYSDFEGMQTAAITDAKDYAGNNYPGMTATASQVCRCSVGGEPVSCPADCNGVTGGSPQIYIQVTTMVPFSPVFAMPGLTTLTSISGKDMKRVQ